MNNISSVSPPSHAANGTIYYDQNNGNNYMYNGKIWALIAHASTPPYDYAIVIDTEDMIHYIDDLRGI